jgi:pimeloyl-ACP methyl ester carboxylesterase
MSAEASSPTRRGFLGTSAAGAATFAALQLATTSGADAQSSKPKRANLPKNKPGSTTSFASLKQIEAGVLNVGYAEAGPADGPVVIALHGWPYDIHCYVDVAPLLASAGYRVIVPYLRGYGTTSFLSSATSRNGQPSAIAVDMIGLMDALRIEKATIAGCDWGARTANIMAALWPERCKAMVSVSGYLIGSQEAGKMPLPPKAELEWWYQYYFATERGRAGYEKYRKEFSRLIWQLASPKWAFDDATFDRSARAFDNPDHVSVVVHIRSPAPTPRNSRVSTRTEPSGAASAITCHKNRRRPLPPLSSRWTALLPDWWRPEALDGNSPARELPTIAGPQ